MRTIGGILVALLLACGGLFWKHYNKASLSAEMRKVAHESIATCDLYAKNSTYMDDLCDRCHDSAFDEAFRMGGRRRASTFDEEQYILALFDEMSERAAAEGRKDVAEELATFRDEIMSGGG